MHISTQYDNTLFIGPAGERSVIVSGLPPDELIAWIEKRLGEDFSFESATVGQVRSNRAELSNRELSILRLIACGRSNQQIADGLFLSLNTVKSYIRTAYRKIGVTTRPQAMLWGVRRGLDGPGDIDESADADDTADVADTGEAADAGGAELGERVAR